MTILCHVSDKLYPVLEPQKPDNCIYFSENKFISFFGEYLYLFDLKTLQDNFRIKKRPTTGLKTMCFIENRLGPEEIRYHSKSLEWEWVCYNPIPVDQFALGVIEHWNHMEGVIGMSGINNSLQEIAVNLMEPNNDPFDK